jgi:ATP-dependent helicase/nuclease subunit A
MKNITFIYAGAGSGKTHKLTDLLFEKINNKEITASEVMLTTFGIC